MLWDIECHSPEDLSIRAKERLEAEGGASRLLEVLIPPSEPITHLIACR